MIIGAGVGDKARSSFSFLVESLTLATTSVASWRQHKRELTRDEAVERKRALREMQLVAGAYLGALARFLSALEEVWAERSSNTYTAEWKMIDRTTDDFYLAQYTVLLTVDDLELARLLNPAKTRH